MLLQYDNRFAEARDFGLLLFNQKIRHTALRSVRDAIYANPNRMKAFETAINTPNLEEDLKKAEANPQGKEARHLVHTFMPLFRTCHAAVPLSTSERYAVMGKMNSMMMFPLALPAVCSPWSPLALPAVCPLGMPPHHPLSLRAFCPP